MGDLLDLIALLWFLVCWLGYTEYSKRRAADRAFFKFTRSMRMYNFVSVMIGGAPQPDDAKSKSSSTG